MVSCPVFDLRISPCPNDTFAFDAMLNGRIDCNGIGFRTSFLDIEQLNRGVLDGNPDISKISYAVYPLIRDRYRILDSGSALGRGNGQLLVRRSGETAPIKSVIAPGPHTTATALLKRYFPAITDINHLYFADIAPAVQNGDADAGVLIHEGRFVYENYGLELVADLGKKWEEETALPLPLGAIVIRRDIPAEFIETVDRLLHRSVEYAMAHPKASRAFVKAHAQEMDDDIINRHIKLFVNDFTVSLGREGRIAVDRFLGEIF